MSSSPLGGAASSPPARGGGGWKAAIFIIVVEMAERFSFYGITGGLMTYLTAVLKEPTATAAKNVNVWQGVAFLLPLIGAFVADSVLGRFRTVFFSSLVYLSGLILLFLSACVIPMKYRSIFIYISLYILAVGEGGHKPSVQTFAADQFDESTPEEKAAKSSFFNWWYFGIVIGSGAGIGSVLFVQKNVGWAVAFGLPVGAMLAALVVFFIGIKFYRRDVPPPHGSPYTAVARVVVAAVRKRGANEEKWGILREEDNGPGPLDSGGPAHRRTKGLRFLDKAMVVDDKDAAAEARNPWRLCTLNQVEQVKKLFRLLPIWFTCFPFSIVYAQLFTFFTKQANTLQVPSLSSHLKIPQSYIPFFFTILLLLVLLPFYERVFVSLMRKLTGHPTGISTLQRIGVGQFLSTIVVLVAALVERKRIAVAKSYDLLDNPKATIPMGISWMLPQYGVLGLAEVFVLVGMQQLFYEQMPEELRSLGAAAYLTVIGIGSFVSSGIIAIVQSATSGRREKWLVDNVNRAHLDGFYWVLTVLCGLGFCGFVWIANRFVYDDVGRRVDQEEPKELTEMKEP